MIIHEVVANGSLRDDLRKLREDMKTTEDIKELRTLYKLERYWLRLVWRDTNADVGDYL